MLSQREALAELLTVSLDDVKVGYELGSGSFSSVYQIKPCPKLVDDFEQHSSKFLPGDLSSEEMATRRSEFSTQKVFALKRLSEETLSDPQRKEVASEALKFEADLLSRLPRHDNLISLHAVSSDFWNSPEKGFLVLECLRETLDLRLKRWRNRASMEGNRINLFRSGRHHVDRRKEQQSRVVNVGLGIAEAMAFLHRHRVLFRDLKPCNVGFGIDGKVRVFDFGLARILHEEEDRRLTFLVGSLRYVSDS
jgi:serine/threonine protein kinase